MQNYLFDLVGVQTLAEKPEPSADATIFLEVTCPILTGSRTPYQNHKGSTVRKDPISATNHKWEVSHLWKSSLSSELRYYPGVNSTGEFDYLF
jgi:hypothetical protein